MSEPGGRPEAGEIPPPPGKGGFVLAALVAAGLLAWGTNGHFERAARAEASRAKQAAFVPSCASPRPSASTGRSS